MGDNEQTRYQELLANATALSKRTELDICERSDLGEMNFVGVMDLVKGAIGAASTLSEILTPAVPEMLIEQCLGRLGTVEGQIKQIDSFKLAAHNDVKAARNSVLQNFEKNAKAPISELITHLIPAVGYYSLNQKMTEMQSAAGLSDFAAQSEKNLHTAEEHLIQIRRAVESAKEAASEAGVERHAANFKLLAEDHQFYSRVWLAAVLITLTFSGWLGYWLVDDLSDRLKELGVYLIADARVLINFSARLAILSLSYVAVIWTMKNYRAHRHLQVVNTQKKEQLMTFKTFVEGATQDDIKNAVLMETTRSIFSPAVTGYLGPNEEMPSTPISDITKFVNRSGS